MGLQISVSNYKEPSRLRVYIESKKDKHSHLIGDVANKACPPDIPWRHTRDFDSNGHRRGIAGPNEHFMFLRAKLRVEPVLLEFVEHQMSPRETGPLGGSAQPDCYCVGVAAGVAG